MTYNPATVPHNRCKNLTHERSETTGRCKTCRLIARKLKREQKVRVTPVRAKTYSGSACRTCGSSTRYVQSNACVACQSQHQKHHSASYLTTYHIAPEFTQWITCPLPVVEHV